MAVFVGWIGLLLLWATSAWAQPIPPAGTWATLPKTAPVAAMAREVTVTGELGPVRGLVAYSGGDLVSLNGVSGFLLWGGGHGDGADNSLYFVPLNGSGPRALPISYLIPPLGGLYGAGYPQDFYTTPSRNQLAVVASDGKYAPKARHTYHSVVAVTIGGRPAAFAVHGSLVSGSGGGTNAVRIFDLTQSYAEAMARPDMGWRIGTPAPSSSVSSASVFLPKTEQVFVRSRNFVGTYTLATDTWTVWPMPAGWPGGSDFEAGIAFDAARGKIYVIGDRLAEVYDIAARTWTDLRSKPWATRIWNAVAWHPGLRALLAWSGGQHLTLIDPVTDVVMTAVLAGATVTAQEGSGTYGRFRLVPGTQSVVLLNAPTQNVLIGTLPLTMRVAPGSVLPSRQWVERPNTRTGQAFMASPGGKHGRAFYHPDLRGLVFAGGDWWTSQGSFNGAGSEIWTLNAFTDTWTLLRPFCVAGEPQPGAPDTVGWAYDRTRNRGLMTPGFYFITQGATSPCGALYGLGGYAFDFATRTFAGPDALAGLPPPPGGWGGDGGASYSVANPALDELVRVRNGPTLERLNLATGTWTARTLSNGVAGWNPIPNRAQLVIDVRDQVVYWLDSQGRKVIKVSLATAAVTQIPLPSQYVAPPGDHDVYLAFDPGTRVLFVPNNVDMGQSALNGLGILHVDTGVWEWEAVPPTVTGSVWGFDEHAGALLGIGKRATPSAYFLYKYGAASALTPPLAPTNLRGRVRP